MSLSKSKRYAVLCVLFFLPVAFLLMLYPSTHNYKPLDIVQNSIVDFKDSSTPIKLEDHISVVVFLGANPMEKVISASNLKELVYDKFKGFKKFQVIVVAPKNNTEQYSKLHTEISRYEDLRFWNYIYLEDSEIYSLFNSLKTVEALDNDLSSDYVYIVDKDLNQRGRLDDRDDDKKHKGNPILLTGYNSIEVAEIKNKMNDDMRILFTEYRQKRKGKFNDSTQRRAKDLKDE